MHLLSYQHFATASFKRIADGLEYILIVFSTHELSIEGRGLSDLLLDLQEMAVK